MIYVALRAFERLEECSALHEPVDGWVWVRCSDVGALLRDCARLLSRGVDPGFLVTSKGEVVDVLDADRVDLSGTLSGEAEIVCLGFQPLDGLKRLMELGVRRVVYKEGRLVADVAGFHVEVLVREGLVPALWRNLPSQRRG